MDEKQIRNIYLDGFSKGEDRMKALTIFGLIDKYEQKTGFELLQMDRDALMAMINSWELSSPASVRNYIRALSGYLAWASENGYCGQNAACDITYREVDWPRGCRANFYPNIGAVLRPLYVLGRPEDGFAAYPLSIFAWMGVESKEAGRLLREAVDFDQGIILCQSSLTFERLSPDMIEILKEYDSCTHYKGNNAIPMVPGKRQFFLYPLDFLNPINSQEKDGPVDPTVVLRVTNATLKKYGNEKGIHYKDIYKSGKLYKAYQMEKNGTNWETKENSVFLQQMLNAPKSYPGDAKIIYHAYKKAFGLS